MEDQEPEQPDGVDDWENEGGPDNRARPHGGIYPDDREAKSTELTEEN